MGTQQSECSTCHYDASPLECICERPMCWKNIPEWDHVYTVGSSGDRPSQQHRPRLNFSRTLDSLKASPQIALKKFKTPALALKMLRVVNSTDQTGRFSNRNPPNCICSAVSRPPDSFPEICTTGRSRNRIFKSHLMVYGSDPVLLRKAVMLRKETCRPEDLPPLIKTTVVLSTD